MPEEEYQFDVTVRAIADGATAQLRVVAKVANREEARRLHAEINRIGLELARKFEFPTGAKEQKR